MAPIRSPCPREFTFCCAFQGQQSTVAAAAVENGDCFFHADTVVDVPAEREVSVHIEDGTSYTVTLYSGRLDVKALKESLADEGLVLRTLNGVVPAYDANGMSRTIFSTDIRGKTQAKKGEACPS